MYPVCILLSIFLTCSCNNTPEEQALKNRQAYDTAGYAPKSTVAPVAREVESAADTVLISNMKFVPDVITVHKGGAVVWVNTDMVAHCVTEAKTKAWTSGPIAAGDSWRMPITKSADYYCAIHQVMKGKIVMK